MVRHVRVPLLGCRPFGLGPAEKLQVLRAHRIVSAAMIYRQALKEPWSP
jgi:hypothetical protein